MIDKIFFIVLVLNATRLFAFLAPQFGVTIGTISLALLALNVCYLIVKVRYSVLLFLRRGMGSWLFVLVLWPLVTVLYAPSINIREIGLKLYYFSLFFCTVVYTVTNGLPAMHRVMSISLVISVVGLVLSMLMPDYFESVALIATGRTKFTGRPFGFFMQPNRLAFGLGLLFIGWFSLLQRKNGLSELVSILALLLVMLLTGSRIGILIAVIIVMVSLVYSLRKRLISGRYYLKICLLMICLVGGVIGTRHYLSSVGNSVIREEKDLIDRMETMLSFKISTKESIKDDESIEARLGAQTVYRSFIKEKPLLGHGCGSEAYYLENDSILVIAHSEALTCAMEYGVLYPLAFGLLIFQLYRKHSRCGVEIVFQTNSISQFVVVVLFLFVVGSLLDMRTLYIVLGMFFATVYFPHLLFKYDSKFGSPQFCMSIKDIRNVRLIKRKSLLSQTGEKSV